MERIIDNALSSIRVGLEDYERGVNEVNDARLTSAVRNVFAGILLLAKGKLYELSPVEQPGLLIRVVRAKVVSGRLEVVPEGQRTIDFAEIKERFKGLAIAFDWTGVERIRAIRNDLEHFYYQGARTSVREALADATVAIRSLMRLLSLDPIRDLGPQWWNLLLNNETLFNEELEACKATLRPVRWLNETAAVVSALIRCPKCGSNLVRQVDPHNVEQIDIRIECAACGGDSEINPLIERAVERNFFSEMYEAQSRGGEFPYVRCPKCQFYALALEKNECAVCGNELDALITWCDNCRNPISANERASNSHRCPAFFGDESKSIPF